MLNKISFNVPPSVVQPALASVAENSIAASLAKSSYSLQSLNGIASAQQNVLWWVVLGLAMLACGEDGPASKNTPISHDNDDDNVPAGKDECPDAGGLNIRGCPLNNQNDDPATMDTDLDGVPDVRDECPEDSHPSLDPNANGCSPLDIVDELPDGGLSPSMPDPRPVSAWQLLPAETAFMQASDAVLCPHLDNNAGQVMVAWQAGSHFYLSPVALSPLNAGLAQDLGEVAVGEVSTCQFTRALAVNSNEQIAVILPQLIDENWVRLSVRVQDLAGNEVATSEIAQLPYPHLGEEQRDTFASIAALPNNQFVVVWADRDQMLATLVNADGTLASEEPIQVSRPIDVLQMSNPDVFATADGFKVIWQEGNAPQGPLVSASFNTQGEKIGEDHELNEDEIPLRFFNFLPQQELSPQFILDEQDRLTLAWIEQYDAADKLRLYSHSEASQLPADTTTIGTQISNIPADSKAALTQQGDTVLLAYPVLQPADSIMLRSLQWTITPGGRESAGQP